MDFSAVHRQRGVARMSTVAPGFREFVERNIEAEALGYVSTFLVEHHFTGFGQVSASLNLFTWIGARTTTLRLGTAVLVLPWHNPVLLAEQVATLDLLSGGRVDFGIGKGYRYNEFAGFCVPMEEAEPVLTMRRSHDQGLDPLTRRGRIVVSTGSLRTLRWSHRRPRSPIRRCGWALAAPPPSKKWRRWATICCWASLTLSRDRRGDCPL